MMDPRSLEGVHPVLYAFFDAAGAPDEEAMRRQVDYCVRNGAKGLMALGLVTEVEKLDTSERRQLVELIAGLNDKRLPLAVTLAEPTAEAQIGFARAAIADGADWLIIQPPPEIEGGERGLIKFFGAVADAVDCPLAIQHNPFNLKSWLSVEAMASLNRQYPNISLIKAEGTAVETEQLIEATSGKLRVFGGHGGIEFPTLLRAGAVGLIPAPDCLRLQVRIFENFRLGTPEAIAEAERLHRALLPLVVFMVRSIPSLISYGKRLMAQRLDLYEILDRQPFVPVTAFGISEMDRLLQAVISLEDDFRT